MKMKAMITLSGAVALSIAPFTVSAYSAETALNACAAAVTSEMSDNELAWRLDEETVVKGRLKGSEVIHLDVRNAETDIVVARADCIVDSRARVKHIKKLPIDAADASERSLTAY